MDDSGQCWSSPWDSLDLDLIPIHAGNARSRIQLGTELAGYLWTVPIGKKIHRSFWTDHWSQCKGAAAYKNAIDALLEYEQRTSNDLKDCVHYDHKIIVQAHASTSKFTPCKNQGKKTDIALRCTPTTRKRPVSPEAYQPIAKRTRSAKKKHPETSTEGSPTSCKTLSLSACAQIVHCHSQIVSNLETLLELLEQAEKLEASPTQLDDVSILDLNDRAIEACRTLDEISRELVGLINVSPPPRPIHRRVDDAYFHYIEKGVVRSWLERHHQSLAPTEIDEDVTSSVASQPTSLGRNLDGQHDSKGSHRKEAQSFTVYTGRNGTFPR